MLYLKGVHATKNKQPVIAIKHLQKAISILDNSSKTWKALGHSYHLQAASTSFKDVFNVILQAKKAYLKAAELNPLDAQIFFRLAIEEARLKSLHVYVGQPAQKDPYNPLPFFKKALQLSPNNATYHHALDSYYHTQNKTEALLNTITDLSQVYPKIYYKLKKEPFWSIEAAKTFQEGIKGALDKKISLREVNLIMSDLFVDEKNWGKAIQYYRSGMAVNKRGNTAFNYMHLGRLYAENGQPEEARKRFKQALDISREKETDLKNLYWFYKKRDRVTEYIRILKEINRNYNPSAKVELLLARSMMDIEKYSEAKQVLIELNSKKPLAESYYLLAKIAEKKKAWDEMELTIQKATMLEPGNYWYHFLFSKALKNLDKRERAEKEATLAIDHSNKPRAWLYDYRGWIRWDMEDYEGAALDWKKAIGITPDEDAYYAYIGLAYDQIGKWKQAAEYFQKAIALDPKNQDHQNKYDGIMKKIN